MRPSDPCESDRMSLVHKHPVHLLRFLSPALATITGVKTRPGLTFHLSQEQIFALRTIKTSCLFGTRRKRFHGHAGRCACVSRYRALLRALGELKEAADHSLETQTECAVALNSLSVSRHHALMYSARFVRACARLCTLEDAPLESKCLMG